MNNPIQARFIQNRAPAALFAALLAAASLSAAVYTWDPANTGNGAAIDAGSGTWDVESTNAIWNDAGANVAWAQTSSTVGLHSAIFGGADAIAGSPYIVTLGSSVATVTSVRFNNSGYVLTAANGSSPVLNTPQIFTATNKSATISGPVSVRFSGTSHFAGYGILTVKDGASLALTTGGNLGFGSGTRVVVEAGGDIASSAAILVGSTNYDGSTSRVTVNGGSLRATGTGANIVLINSASVSADTTSLSTVLTLTSGVISNASPGGGVRFGGANSSISSAISGTIHLDGGVLTTARVYEGSGTAVTGYNSTFNFNGGTLQALSNTTVGGTFLRFLNNAFVKAGGAFIDTNGATITIAQPLITDATSLGGGLTKLGAGVLTLTGANTYTGPTNISAGTLNVDAPYSAITAATVSPSARLQITSGATASSLPAITLQGGSILGLNLGSYNASNLATAQVATFNAEGNYNVDLSGTNIPVGSYTVITYGSKSGTGEPSLGQLPPGVTATVQDTGSSLVLNVLTPQLTNYTWNGAVDNIWDIATANWSPGNYVEGTLATFPNLAGDKTVSLSAIRSPYSVAIQNISPNTYLFEGNSIGGAAKISKSGTGLVTFSVPNAYTGETTIVQGGLLVAANEALGTAAGSTTVSDGAFVGLTGGVRYTTPEPLYCFGGGNTAALGSIIASRGAIQSVSGHSEFAGPIFMSAAGLTRFGSQDGASLSLSGTIAPAPGVTGVAPRFRPGSSDGDFITLSGSNNQWDADAAIFTGSQTGNAGVRLGIDNGMSTTASVSGSGSFTGLANSLDLNGFNQTMPGLIRSDGYLQITNLKAGTTSVFTLNTSTMDYSSVAASPDTNSTYFTDGAGGAGKVAVVKKGSYKQTLQGIHAYTGPTTIEAGTLAFARTGALGATPVTLSAGSTLDVSGISATDFALSGGLSGSGTLTATAKTVTVASAFTPGALAISGNLTLAAGTATTLVAAATPDASSAVTVNGALALNGTLAITEAGGFDFATGQTFTFATATGGVTAGLTGVTVNAVALTEATPDVWTASIDGLNYTFTESTATLAVSGGVAITGIQTWRDLHFPNEGNDGTGIGANTADADGDGIANLLEYATNTSPRTANAPVVVQGTNAGRLTLTFPRIDDPTLRYTVEGRDDLATGAWAAVTPAAANNPSFGFAGSTPGVTETQSETVVDTVVITAQPRRFLRLSVDFVPAP